MKVACNWLAHVHQVTGARLRRQLNTSTDSLKLTRCQIDSQWRTSRIVDEMLSNLPQVNVVRSSQNAIAII